MSSPNLCCPEDRAQDFMHSRQTHCQLTTAACAQSLTVSVKWETGVSSIERRHPLKGDSNSDWGKTVKDPVVPGTQKHMHCSATLSQTHGPSLSYGKKKKAPFPSLPRSAAIPILSFHSVSAEPPPRLGGPLGLSTSGTRGSQAPGPHPDVPRPCPVTTVHCQPPIATLHSANPLIPAI